MNCVNFEEQKEELQKRIDMLKDITDENLETIIECMEGYNKCNCYFISDFNEYVEGCYDELNNLIGEDKLKKTLNLFDLYIEHFGMLQGDAWNDLRTIGAGIISCHINLIMEKVLRDDYGL